MTATSAEALPAAREMTDAPRRWGAPLMGRRAADRAGVPGDLSAADAGVRRAEQFQSGRRRIRQLQAVGQAFPQGARQRERPPRLLQCAGRLRRRHHPGGRDRSRLFVDRRAHQHAVQGLHRRRQHGPAVRAAAGRRRRLGHPGFAQDRPAQHRAQVDQHRLPLRLLLDVGADHRLRHLLRALCLHVHRLGAQEHGPQPRGGRGGVGRVGLHDALHRHLPADRAGHPGGRRCCPSW